MAQDLGNITTSQTFQNWFNKTNDIVDLLASNVVTAAPAGSTTTGSATITGNFTAANVIGSTKISTNTIEAVTGGSPVNVNGAFQVTGAAQLTTTFLNSAGAQTRYSNGTLSWDVGLENSSPGNFIINTGVAPNKFSLSTAGTLTVPDAVVIGSLTVGSLTIGAGGAGLSTDDVSEGSTNLYHTTARARAAFSGGDGINLSATGVISFDGDGELDTYKGNKFIGTGGYVDANNYAYIEGRASGGQGYLRIARYVGGTNTQLVDFASNMNVYSAIYTYGDSYSYVSNGGNKTYHHDVSENTTTFFSGGSTIKAQIDGDTGSAVFVGDVTTNGSFSDERLKENIKPLEKGLETIEQIKTYTFNYKERPQDTHPGVIAQEIEELVPEVVYDIEMEDGTYKAVRYQQLVPLLINAIKDLSEKVNVLENKLINKE